MRRMERPIIFFLNMSNLMLLLDVAICFWVHEMCVDDIPDDGMLTKHNLLYSSLSNNLLSFSTLSLYCHRMQPCASTSHLVAMPKSMGVYI